MIGMPFSCEVFSKPLASAQSLARASYVTWTYLMASGTFVYQASRLCSRRTLRGLLSACMRQTRVVFQLLFQRRLRHRHRLGRHGLKCRALGLRIGVLSTVRIGSTTRNSIRALGCNLRALSMGGAFFFAAAHSLLLRAGV